MSISDLHPTPGPAEVLADAVALVREAAETLFATAESLGHGAADMVAVIEGISASVAEQLCSTVEEPSVVEEAR